MRMTMTRKAGAALVACMVVAAMAACAPQSQAPSSPQESDGSKGESTQAVAESAEDEAGSDAKGTLESMGYSYYADEDSGIYPESFYTKNYMNSGNRGCNSCHEDLWELVVNRNNLVHLASTEPGYGKNANWLDCYGCHQGWWGTGTFISDSIHGAHYTNEVFTEELGGTCFSCHAVNSEGDLVMWDFYRYSSEFGGFINQGSEKSLDWIRERNVGTDTYAGITVQHDMPVTVVSMDQKVSEKEDHFGAQNYAIPEVDVNTWTLKVTGVKNPREFTLEELYQLPITEKVVTEACSVNSIGSYQIHNAPLTGVLVSDIVEACGGLEDGMQSVDFISLDTWGEQGGGAMGLDASMVMDEIGAIVVLEYWDEPLSEFDGFPASIGLPGISGGSWVKWLDELKFKPDAGWTSKWKLAKDAGRAISGGDATNIDAFSTTEVWEPQMATTINMGWLSPDNDGTPVNDGDVLKLDANGKVKLNGYSYVWGHGGHRPEQVAFSADYGNTWTYIDIPETLDPFQWTTFTIEWEPKGPGVYVLYGCTIDNQEGWQTVPTPITVVVEE